MTIYWEIKARSILYFLNIYQLNGYIINCKIKLTEDKMKITELLNIKYPIIQGGMARVAGGRLAAAVSNAGGLGLVASGGFTLDQFKHELEEADKYIDDNKFYGVNIVLLEKDIEEKIDVTIEKKVKVITLSAGNPTKYIQRFIDNDIMVFCVVGNAKMAKKAEALGATAIIFEGLEAGGHIGDATTFATLPQIVEAVSIPVISAGGIATGAQILAAQVLGAAGIQMGTRFLVADETPIHDNFKDAVVKYQGYETDLTGGDHPVRQLSNKMTQEYIRLYKENAPEEELIRVVTGSLSRAVYDGDVETGSMMAGQNVGLIKKRDSVEGIFRQLTDEYQNAKKKVGALDDFLF
ncbi:MAG: nitronate monooxygenase [Tissierellia bacterium]|nr:nitronate monooxygenase [Tissierellia bacterium]